MRDLKVTNDEGEKVVGLTVKSIRALQYSRTPRSNASNGQTIYPKQILWDDTTVGFGVRVFPTNKKSFVYQYRTNEGGKRLASIGAFGTLTLDQARDKAQRWAAALLDGKDPLAERQKHRHGISMEDFCAIYIDRHAKIKKRSWLEDERRNRLYIIPMIGKKQVQHVLRREVAELHDQIGRIQAKPYMANRVREQLSKMFELAKTWGIVEEGFINPARGITDFEERERDEYIKPEDMPIVKAAIDREPNQVARCVIWLFLLTGKRKSELLEATWQNLDEKTKTLKIPLTKNSDSEFLSLSPEAWKVIECAKRFRVVGNPYIFPGEAGKGHFVNVRRVWNRIKADAERNGAKGLDRVPIHGLRHTFAVYAVSLGGSDLGTVRALLNHRSLRATTVYAKHLTSTKREAFDRQGALMQSLALANE